MLCTHSGWMLCINNGICKVQEFAEPKMITQIPSPNVSILSQSACFPLCPKTVFSASRKNATTFILIGQKSWN